jgi:hypothetical protein
MTILVKQTELVQAKVISSSEVHNVDLHYIYRVIVDLGNWKKDDFFTLSYLFGNSATIERLFLESGGSEAVSKVLSLIQRHRGRSCCIQEFEVISINGWDQRITSILNQALLNHHDTTTRLKRLSFLYIGECYRLDGIDLSSLEELSLHLINEDIVCGLATALSKASDLRLLCLRCGRLENAEKGMELLGQTLRCLPRLLCLRLDFPETLDPVLRRLAKSVPDSLRALSIIWRLPETSELISLIPATQNITSLSLSANTDIQNNVAVRSLRRNHPHENGVIPFLQACIANLKYVSIDLPKRSTRSEIHGLLHIFSLTESLCTLEISNPSVRLDSLACDLLCQVLQNNKKLCSLKYAFKVPQNQRSRIFHYQFLNRIHYHDEVLAGTVSPSLWPLILTKASRLQNSVVFEILLQKNDAIIQR